MTSPSSHRRPVGALSVFPLSLGGNVFGWTADARETFAVLDAYTAAGGNFVDTADSYSAWIPGHEGGESETLIGEWLTAGGPARRESTVIATKVARHPRRQGLSGANIKAAADDSLRRLRTDYIDLYYTHFDDESVEVSEIIAALDDLVRAGKVREIAVSNISPERLTASLAFSEAEGLARYVALQPHYNLVSRDTYEGDRARIAAEAGLAVVPYYGLAAGFLTGKYRENGPEVASARAAGAAKHLETSRGRRCLAALDKVSASHGVEPATVALAWLLTRPLIAAPIASARTTDQLPALLASVDLTLTPEDLTLLDDASA
ncbi:Aldo-keto reductase IolS [Streptomyces sp. RB5]|uniref:Aldo-keto reductase IolS n=1 Tax=Streptomyces smaragdinus TaxID=2585196 RepID=A0A7K0CTR4_9ACTN|nr:aldo/keto reductase [Streptomyces smaragdinus]MQY16867.1 Aldo-keto reductase IolS [Streptomyces smaragdinus]